MINNFDTSVAISGAEIHVNPCAWQSDPTLSGSASHEMISFTASLREEGKIYAIAIKADDDPAKPYSYELTEGIDGANRPTKNLYEHVEANVLANMTFS
jgi:hypothetical protein